MRIYLRTFGWIGMAVILSWSNAFAEPVTGLIYERGAGKQLVLYSYERQEKKVPEGLKIQTSYADPAGKKVVEEEALVKDGALQVYRLTHHQLNAKGEVRIEGDQALFSYSQGGKNKTGREKVDETFVVGPTIVLLVQNNWQSVLAGKELKVRYAVPDRAETVGFTFSKMGSGTVNGRQVVMVRMKPTSPIIAALVDPLIFTFSPDGAHLLELKGRTLPRKRVNGDWKDFDADIVYKDPDHP